MIRACELLHAISSTLLDKMALLLASDNYKLLETLALFARERSYLVRKHTFGLLGEIVKHIQPQSDAHATQISELLQQVTSSLTYCAQPGVDYAGNEQLQMVSNAAWTIGEVALFCWQAQPNAITPILNT